MTRYRLRRNQPLAFQPFQELLDDAGKGIPRRTHDTVPHYSRWYEADSMQDLINKIEFATEAEGDDEVLTESGEIVGRIGEEFAKPVLIDNDGSIWTGPEVRAMGDPTKMDSETYAEKMVTDIFRKH